jgi:hypothetical protein
VKDRDNFEAVASEPIRDHVRGAWDHQFAGARDAAGATEIGQFGETGDGLEQRACDATGSLWIVVRDMRPEMRQVL